MTDFLKMARDRFSCRKFSDRPVEQEKIDKIIDAATFAPTAVNYQPFKIWVIQSPEALAKVAETTTYTFGTSLIFAVGANQAEGWVRKSDGKSFADVDASIAATHMMLEIEELGLGTTWVGAFDVSKLNGHFPEMADYSMIALFPVGYPAEDAEPSPLHWKSKEKSVIASSL